MNKTISDQVFDDNRESAKLKLLETIAGNSHHIANELKRIGDILQSFPTNQPELQRIANMLEERLQANKATLETLTR